ncbi:NAD(P)H-hydrate epimerase [Desulfovibrio sp. OttesenSCG-928-G15]|nr:NAD(P)H-hydrate epimerase [Desulfovibrio sp. OttesenSCG-928-G15]
MEKSFTSLLPPLPTPQEMNLWDKAAGETYHIPPLLLMENAARGVMEALHEQYPLPDESRILVVMGKGNNGGDGAALARLLHDEGHSVLLLSVAPVEQLPGPAREHAAMAQAMGVPFQVLAPDMLDTSDTPAPQDSPPAPAQLASFLPAEWLAPDVVVDALCGTGLRGNLRFSHLGLVRLINFLAQRAFVLSIDIPSGLHGISGRPMPDAVTAKLTVCLEAGKPGLFAPQAAPFTGQIVIRRVGIPRAVRTSIPASWRLLAPKHGSYPPPSRLRHKGNGGRVCIIGGSKGMVGAPLLAALGALRAGAGLVHVLVPAGLEDSLRSALPEAMVHGMGSLAEWSSGALDQIEETLSVIQPDALLVGPGMGRSRGTLHVLTRLLAQPGRAPAVIDADALYFLRFGDEEHIKAANEPHIPAPGKLGTRLIGENDILTPHPKEMARLLSPALYAALGFVGPADRDNTTNQPPLAVCPDLLAPEARADLTAETRFVQNNRAEVLNLVLALMPGTLVLKGPGTLVGTRANPVVLSPVATSTLGVGGSGDVLSGVCAAQLASGLGGYEAACLGVYLHGYAGKLLSRKAPLGHTARDIASAIPLAWANLCSR